MTNKISGYNPSEVLTSTVGNSPNVPVADKAAAGAAAPSAPQASTADTATFTGSAQTLMRHVEKDKLGIALKGAAEPVRQFFLKNMSSRAAKMLLDDMQAMGPVRLRDVDEAQGLLVNLAKDLAAKGEIVISKSRGEEELIY